jgi:DNA-binding response OmpR family regulator
MTRILVVENDPRFGAALELQLRNAHLTVDRAQDGQEALEFTATAGYDAIVLDVLLPRVGGLEVCRRLRAAGTRTPILMLTARAARPDNIECLDSGADDCLTKPFALGELLARLRALQRRDANWKDGVLRFGDLRLDPASLMAWWGERPLGLRARESRVLELLLRPPGRLVSREAIIGSNWGFEFSDNSNLVEVYIRRLRQKLGEQGAPALIRTVRGAGYRLEAPGA